MNLKIKNTIDKRIKEFLNKADSCYKIKRLSPILSNTIREFVTRDGKRVRPILFILGYLGFNKKEAKGLYESAISIELLHDFMLVHDDIIDKSGLRRGKPSMHKIFDRHIAENKNIKFSGQDLAIVAGDVMYAMGLASFLSIDVAKDKKEKAMRKLIEAAINTGSGEFLELMLAAKDISKIKKEQIYQVYDYKTACYTFASPLAIGAILAGANNQEAQKLYDYGIYLGRAFQIKDDILGMFSSEEETGKPLISDLQESKRTLLMWHAYQMGTFVQKKYIKKVLSGEKIGMRELKLTQDILISSGSLAKTKEDIVYYASCAKKSLSNSKISPEIKDYLDQYSSLILNIQPDK
ncbi:MAG: polyprenyl synthetase family protein [Candidatus Omnitrophica bacterium]|jgi:geranylgeranyl diphosphate synthase type I|nr:polyprenyl synthetase family protein [Candidatus Omnitrophota bacterium]